MWRITPICCGVLEGLAQSGVTYGHGQGQTIDLPILAYVLTGSDGAILVDSGPLDPEQARERGHVPLNQDGGRTLLAELDRIGVRVGQIRAIVHTHLHWDHCGGDGLVPDVPVFVQREELRFAIAPPPQQLLFYESPLIGLEPPWIPQMRRFVLLEGAAELEPGLSVIPVPGHSDGSQAVIVQTTRGPYCITGDLIDTYENWSGRLPGCPEWMVGIPAGVHTNLDAWYASVRRLRDLKVPVLPAHDLAVMDQAPFGE